MKSFEELKEPKEFKIGGLQCAVGKIPAFYAQRIMLASGDALSGLNMAKLPESVLMELLSYCAVRNPNGEWTVLENIDIVNLLVKSTVDLVEIELKAVEYNFGFFFDGSLQKVFEPLMKLIAGSAEGVGTSTPSAAS